MLNLLPKHVRYPHIVTRDTHKNPKLIPVDIRSSIPTKGVRLWAEAPPERGGVPTEGVRLRAEAPPERGG
eukprot:2267837-Pyramimonas_sp.AAC.1